MAARGLEFDVWCDGGGWDGGGRLKNRQNGELGYMRTTTEKAKNSELIQERINGLVDRTAEINRLVMEYENKK